MRVSPGVFELVAIFMKYLQRPALSRQGILDKIQHSSILYSHMGHLIHSDFSPYQLYEQNP